MSYCAKCGSELNFGAKFCPKCGASTSITEDGGQVPDNKKQVTTKKTTRKKKTSTGSRPTKRATTKKSGNSDTLDGIIGITVIGLVIIAILWFLGAFEGEILSIPEGRAAFTVEDQNCSNTSITSINKIILYEGNSRQDCKVEGETKSGEPFTYNGKWEKEDVSFFSFRKYYILKFNEFNLLINGDKEVCFHKGSDSDVSNALKHSSIGKLNPINQEEENKISEKFLKKIEEQKKKEEAKRMEELKEYLGTYYYDYCPPGMPLNISFYYKITLKPDGTFSHEGSNEETKRQMEIETVVDRKNYPSGGKWSVINTAGMKGVFLYFDGNWGTGSINLENGVLEIPNMNGYRLKVRTRKE